MIEAVKTEFFGEGAASPHHQLEVLGSAVSILRTPSVADPAEQSGPHPFGLPVLSGTILLSRKRIHMD